MHFKNKLQKTFWMIFSMITLFNCQKEISVPQLPYTSRVVIQGVVEPDSVPIVYFNRTVPFLTGSTSPADLVIRNANILISSMGESDKLKLDSTLDRIDCRYVYFYKGAIKAKRNTTYTLSIFDGLKTYTATTTTSLTPATIDSIAYTADFKDLYGGHEGVITYFKDIPNQANYYRFEMLRAVDSTVRDATVATKDKSVIKPCLGNDTIFFRELGRSVYNDENLDGQQIKIVIEPALTHPKEGPATVRIQTIDKETYDFYNQLDGQKLALYNPFVEPYFLRDGQFGKEAVGFFGSMIRSEPVTFTLPVD